MGFFDEHWKFESDHLVCVHNEDLRVACPNRVIPRNARPDGVLPLDAVMAEMGFVPVASQGSTSCVMYADQQQRRLKELVSIGFGFPPVGLRFEILRDVLEAWWNSPDRDEPIAFVD